MPIRFLRRIKAGEYEIETRLYGPIDTGDQNTDVPAIEVIFTETRLNELQDGGLIESKIRAVGEIDLEDGKKYLLGWTLWGAQGAKLEFAIDKGDTAGAANFKTIVEDELPGPGVGIAFSRQTPSGLLWINSKYIRG